MSFLIFLGIISLLDNMRRELKVKWFSLWFQTNIPLASRPKRSLMDHILSMSSLVSSASITSLSTHSKLVGSCYDLFFGFRRYYSSSAVSSWTNILILQVSPQGSSLMRSSMVDNQGFFPLFNTSQCLLGIGALCNQPFWAWKYLMGNTNWSPRLFNWYIFCLEVRAPRWAPQKGYCLKLRGVLTVF